MNSILLYVLKSTISLCLFYLLFRIFLGNNCSFNFKRTILLSIIFASLLIPVIYIPQNTNKVVSEKLIPVAKKENLKFQKEPIFEKMESTLTFPKQIQQAEISKKNRRISKTNLILYIYLGGGILFVLILLSNISKILLIFKKATIKKMEVFRLAIIDSETASFTFLKSIVISKNDYDSHGAYILTHEKAHIELCHYYDLILLEIIKIIHWFNPIVYWIIKDLKQIHEFQADEITLRSGLNAIQYQLLIIKKSVGANKYAFANSFNQSQIKKRITMINNPKKLKSPKWKIFTFIPLAAILIYVFSACSELQPETQNPSSKIMGTWELVLYKYGSDSVLLPSPNKRIKIISDTTFCWVETRAPMSLVSDIAGGTYSFSDSSYIENIEYGGPVMIPYVGREQKFTVTINNDTLYLKGSLSTSEEIEEIWVKMYTN